MKGILKNISVYGLLLSFSLSLSAMAKVGIVVANTNEMKQSTNSQKISFNNYTKIQAIQYLKMLIHTKKVYLKFGAKLVSLNSFNRTSCDTNMKVAIIRSCVSTGLCVLSTPACITMWACHWGCWSFG